LSRYPIDTTATRTFQKFRWSALPEALRPADPENGQPFHDDATWKAMRLSSKNHADVVIDLPRESIPKQLHFLVSHPTPPVFDGPEDLNGRRNHDEIDFWRRYISESDADYLIDDQGRAGGLGANDFFVIAGDLNSDPNKGDSRREGIRGLLDHRRIQDPKPTNRHGRSATASFGEGEGVRIDYVLPSSNMQVVASQVVWPRRDEPLGEAIHATDHRMVYVDLVVPE
ncbi:MAG: endonuclease/exonuclease/phosphatase family protein, partial [Planctomycetota bacterium]